MLKAVTCISRNAREYCKEHSSASANLSGAWTGYDELLKNLCTELLTNETIWVSSDDEPQFVARSSNWILDYESGGIPYTSNIQFWIYKNRVYEEESNLDFSQEERSLLVREEFDRERKHFEKLQAKFSAVKIETATRKKIPAEVRIHVWQRDGGRCVECGSNENLEYDHIIPFSKGGSCTERNLQLLCSNCNRLKSDRIQ